MNGRHLATYLDASAAEHPDRPAVIDPDGTSLSYRKLNERSSALAGLLQARGVRKGDRVGVVLPKSIEAVVSLFGVMKAGAAYVPIDFTAPTDRGRRILADCEVSAVIVDQRVLDVVPNEGGHVRVVIVTGGAADNGAGSVPFADAVRHAAPQTRIARSASDLAYILYTSGSTGMPKGVMLTHENATSFVDWCSSVFMPSEQDRFSSHAPFHFDLSVLDIYVAIKHGASVHLISESLGKTPKDLSRFIVERRITVWYSTPSILTLLLQHGNLDGRQVPDLRLVLFAGEVFPVKHLREVQRRWPAPAYYNLYGPTETNVCTFARIPAHVPDERDVPYPIGFACSHCGSLVLDGVDGSEVAAGDEGLLYISGPSVFQGYWNRPKENAAAFIERKGIRWYNTGDLVRWSDEGFLYAGRNDRMVKRRGYRIELGEIERALYLHPRLKEVAVVSLPDPDSGVRIVAFVAADSDTPPSIIELKTFCATKLPAYMSPDRFVFERRLPRTSTDKTDYQALKATLVASPVS